jgi:hypothetical protein
MKEARIGEQRVVYSEAVRATRSSYSMAAWTTADPGGGNRRALADEFHSQVRQFIRSIG